MGYNLRRHLVNFISNYATPSFLFPVKHNKTDQNRLWNLQPYLPLGRFSRFQNKPFMSFFYVQLHQHPSCQIPNKLIGLILHVESTNNRHVSRIVSISTCTPPPPHFPPCSNTKDSTGLILPVESIIMRYVECLLQLSCRTFDLDFDFDFGLYYPSTIYPLSKTSRCLFDPFLWVDQNLSMRRTGMGTEISSFVFSVQRQGKVLLGDCRIKSQSCT